MIPINIFSRYDRAVMAARERERRARIGRWKRLREDAGDIAALLAIAIVGISVTVLPWAIGAWVLGRWAFTTIGAAAQG